jgi:hypothetical protein
VKELVGSGDRIMLLALPFVIAGVALNVRWPALFSLGGPPVALKVLSVLPLIPGSSSGCGPWL